MDNQPPNEAPPTDQNPNSPQFLNDDQNSKQFSEDSQNPYLEFPLSSSTPLFRPTSFTKRKKGKPNLKKLQAIHKKCQTLNENLRLFPFAPAKILFFSKYENLLRNLGLWDFVHVQLGRDLRVDLIAQLVASYDSKARCSFVNGVKILVNRTDLGRAFKLPVKKERVNVVGEGVEDDESIGFVLDFVSNWLLLHDDGWVMPREVLNWMKVIKDGHLEKIDWAGLLWFMVEKELTRGEQLVDCYYASHLQYLMIHQAEEMVLAGEPDKVELDGEEKEVVVGVANEGWMEVICTNEVQKGEVDLVGEVRKGEVGEGTTGVDSITDIEKEGADVGVESLKVESVGKESKEEVGEGNLGIDSINYVQKESVDVGVEPELVDLPGEERKGEVCEGSWGVHSITNLQKEEFDVGVESEMVGFAGEESKEEVGEETVEVDSMTDIQKGGADGGVESSKVESVGKESKAEVGEGTLGVNSINYVQKESVDVGVELELVDLAGEDRKGEVCEGSLGVHSITDSQKEEVDVGVEAEMVDFAIEVSKGEVCEGTLGLDSITYVRREKADATAESKLVDLAGEERKGEVGEGSFRLNSITDVQEEEVDVPERLNIELTLGKDTGVEEEIVVEEEKVCDAEMMDLEEGNEGVGDDKLAQWQLDAEHTIGEPTLQRCNMGHGTVFYNYESIEEEVEDIEEDGEAEDPFDSLENHSTLVRDGLTGNFLQAMQANKLAFSSHEQFHDQPDIGLVSSRNDMQHDPTGPSYCNSGSKRVIEHMPENSLNGNGKRLRIDGPWNNEAPNFAMCMDGMEQVIRQARMMYEAKEQSMEHSNMSEQILLSEVHKRDSVIEHLKTKCKEMQEKDDEIYRLDREVQVMGNLLNGHREALKETQKAFAEYQQHNPLPEESIYKDGGPGGLMLTTEAIETRQLKQKELCRTNCLMLEQKAKEAEDGYARQFEAFFEKVGKLDSRLAGLENEMMELKNSSKNHKGSETEQPISSNASLPDGYDEAIENEHLEKPISGEMLEQPASSMNDMLDKSEGTENEHPVSRETSTPDYQRGAEMEQN